MDDDKRGTNARTNADTQHLYGLPLSRGVVSCAVSWDAFFVPTTVPLSDFALELPTHFDCGVGFLLKASDQANTRRDFHTGWLCDFVSRRNLRAISIDQNRRRASGVNNPLSTTEYWPGRRPVVAGERTAVGPNRERFGIRFEIQ